MTGSTHAQHPQSFMYCLLAELLNKDVCEVFKKKTKMLVFQFQQGAHSTLSVPREMSRIIPFTESAT